ncbi:MAG: STAS domain-containing protein [Desulfuromonadales bacterium]|nr:MAG: STAS domain-containing protein [Desulfuromonadales bacterium]
MDGLTIERTQTDEMFGLGLEGELTIPFAGEFRDALLDALDVAGRIVVNVEKVCTVDLTGLQLLCSAHRTAAAREKVFGLEGVANPAFAEAVNLAGFCRHVGCVRDAAKTCIWMGGCE